MALGSLAQTITRLRNIASTHRQISKEAKTRAITSILHFANLLGLLESQDYKKKLPDEAKALIEKRDALRKAKNYEEADKIRKQLKESFGLSIEDSEYGTIWYY